MKDQNFKFPELPREGRRYWTRGKVHDQRGLPYSVAYALMHWLRDDDE